MTKISVVIPAYNEEKFIHQTLESINNQSRKPDEFLIIDNNSKDNTAKIAKKYGAKVILEKRQGQKFALQTGFALAQGDIICSTDADTVVPKDWIEKIEKIITRNHCAVGGPLLYPDAPVLIRWGAEILPKLHGSLYSGELAGPNTAFWKDLYLQIGGIDISLESGWDIDLGEKFRKLGKLHYDPTLAVITSSRRFDNHLMLPRYFINYLGVKFKKPSIIRDLPNIRR